MTALFPRAAHDRHAPRKQASPAEAPQAGGWLVSALAAGCVIVAVAAAVAAMQFGHLPMPAGAAAPAATGARPSAASPATPIAAASRLAGPIRWSGNELLMDLDAVPLPQAVAWLAQASGSTVTGADTLAPTPVTLQFRGRDISAAWRQLLRSHPAAALSCGASACRVWIADSASPQGPAAVSFKAQTDAPRDTRPADTSPEEIESQPGGSC